jgi:hypothetical protein
VLYCAAFGFYKAPSAKLNAKKLSVFIIIYRKENEIWVLKTW